MNGHRRSKTPGIGEKDTASVSLKRGDRAAQPGFSYATVNRCRKGLSDPSKPAKARLETFCRKMTGQDESMLQQGGGQR